MPPGKANGHDGWARRVLFIQATEPAGYPPLINAAILMAEAGWDVTFLAAPIAGNRMLLPTHPRIAVHAIAERPSHVIGRLAYLRYSAAAAQLALRLRPDVVYASDPLGALPGLLAARLAGARLVYHEHDTPAPGSLRPSLSRARAAAAQRAHLVVFPNEKRSRLAKAELGFVQDRLRIVWNLPRRAELPSLVAHPDSPLILYYHGNIAPDRLPVTVIEAVRRLDGRVCLRIAGPEAPGASGYVKRLLASGVGSDTGSLIEYLGQMSRTVLMAIAAENHIGLALMPRNSGELNMRHMTGASNKAFDYMAAGLALLVSDLPDWHDTFVEPGFARACNPADPSSIAAALAWFLNHPSKRREMAAQARARIEADWNYDAAFESVMSSL
jgi:glycosyltransferase involved in cell wall biosynthesis